MLFRSLLETPYGTMQLAVDADGVLVEVWLPDRGPPFTAQEPVSAEALAGTREAQTQLGEYFGGKRQTFDLRFEPRIGSEFEQNVWKRLCDIPYGSTISYGAIAAEFGLANGARAVGRANGANPIPIVIPCHRVIGSDGTLVGYGGGMKLKRELLELEGAIAPLPPRLF